MFILGAEVAATVAMITFISWASFFAGRGSISSDEYYYALPLWASCVADKDSSRFPWLVDQTLCGPGSVSQHHFPVYVLLGSARGGSTWSG